MGTWEMNTYKYTLYSWQRGSTTVYYSIRQRGERGSEHDAGSIREKGNENLGAAPSLSPVPFLMCGSLVYCAEPESCVSGRSFEQG